MGLQVGVVADMDTVFNYCKRPWVWGQNQIKKLLFLQQKLVRIAKFIWADGALYRAPGEFAIFHMLSEDDKETFLNRIGRENQTEENINTHLRYLDELVENARNLTITGGAAKPS